MEQRKVGFSEACKQWGISTATGRNWIRLGRIKAEQNENGQQCFSEAYVAAIDKQLQSGTDGLLRSRRNKTRVTGNELYSGYLTYAKAEAEIAEVLNKVKQTPVQESESLTEAELRCLLAAISISLFRNHEEKKDGRGLLEFLLGELTLGIYDSLILDLVKGAVRTGLTSRTESLCRCQVTYVPGQDQLGLAYISLSGLGKRKASGSYYTPGKVTERLVEEEIHNGARACNVILDPACGTGNFLLQLAVRGFEMNTLYGQDIDEINILLLRINMALFYRPRNLAELYEHFQCKNTLLKNFADGRITPTLIIGNPPWGSSFNVKESEELSARYITAAGASQEAFSIFLEWALQQLPEGGHLAFVLPEALLQVGTHHMIREMLLKQSQLLYVSFLNHAFPGVQCPAILLGLRKTTEAGITGCRVQLMESNSPTGKKQRFIITKNRDRNDLMLTANDQEYECIRKLYQKKQMTYLFGNATFALGIVTGDNKRYLQAADGEPILRGRDVFPYRYQPPDERIAYKPELFQQCAATELYRAPEKLVYRFISNRLVFAYDNRGILPLNSCNILIPEIFSLDMKYIMAVLNSRVANFIWQKKFGSIKVLRSQIEQIPIPELSKEKQREIIQLVDELLEEEKISDFRMQRQLDLLEQQIEDAYGLSEEECKIIRSAIRKNLHGHFQSLSRKK